MSNPKTCDCASTGSDAINTCQRVVRGRVEPPCDCECHKPTQQQKCADLAQAMGIPESKWPRLCRVESHPLDESYDDPWCIQCAAFVFQSSPVPPNPYESAKDKDALVTWLAADDARWYRFLN